MLTANKEFKPVPPAHHRELRHIVRCGPIGRGRTLRLRIAHDIIDELGWQDGADLGVREGNGEAVGYLYLAPAKKGEVLTRKLCQLPRTKARAISIGLPDLHLKAPTETITIPHEIIEGGLALDMRALWGGGNGG